MGILEGNEVYTNAYTPRTQVYMATHIAPTSLSQTSWSRSSKMNRSFISFSFGGKWIEDWNLIATIDGDRMQRQGSANFEDLVSTYDVADGQFYWGTHYTNNHLVFNLATDGITQEELDDFRNWFAPGEMRELILAEHPNRAIMARISAPLDISVLPFEMETEVKIKKKTYKTSTTVYRGQITVSFDMDEPFWYSLINCYTENTKNANGVDARTLSDKDSLKVILEDHIPIDSIVKDNILIGDNKIVQQGTINDNEGYYLLRTTNETKNYGYLYYPGNAPVSPIIQFTFYIHLDDNGYIDSPRNSFTDSETPYDSLYFESLKTYELKYSLPSAYIGYNQAIKIFNTIGENVSLVDLHRLLRDSVTHKYARAWAMMVADYLQEKSGENKVTTNENLVQAKTYMKYFLCTNDSDNFAPTKVMIDCKTGKAISVTGYRKLTSVELTNDAIYSKNRSLVYDDELDVETTTGEFETVIGNNKSNIDSNIPYSKNENIEKPPYLTYTANGIPQDENSFLSFGKFDINLEEDSGNMLKSAYIKLEDINKFDNDGMVSYWTSNQKENGYRFWHNTLRGLYDIQIKYKYMYH